MYMKVKYFSCIFNGLHIFISDKKKSSISSFSMFKNVHYSIFLKYSYLLKCNKICPVKRSFSSHSFYCWSIHKIYWFKKITGLTFYCRRRIVIMIDELSCSIILSCLLSLYYFMVGENTNYDRWHFKYRVSWKVK